jgi:hypothetical protein
MPPPDRPRRSWSRRRPGATRSGRPRPAASTCAPAERERAAGLEERAAAAERDGAALEAEARELGARLGDEVAPEPGAGPAGVAEWGTEARAALLVSRSRLAAERDAVVRQAHELGAAVLGEDLPALGAREVVRHVESTLGR